MSQRANRVILRIFRDTEAQISAGAPMGICVGPDFEKILGSKIEKYLKFFLLHKLIPKGFLHRLHRFFHRNQINFTPNGATFEARKGHFGRILAHLSQKNVNFSNIFVHDSFAMNVFNKHPEVTFRLKLGSFWVILGSFWDFWGPVRGHFEVILGSFWGYFGDILGSFWSHLGSFWGHFGDILGSFQGSRRCWEGQKCIRKESRCIQNKIINSLQNKLRHSYEKRC